MLRFVPSLMMRNLVERSSKAYVAGHSIDDAIKALKSVNARGWKAITCAWDREGDQKDEVFKRYLETLNEIINHKIDSNLSVKLPSLQFDLDMLRFLLKKAAPHQIRIHFDSMAPETADPTFQIAQLLRPSFSNMGITLASRWVRSMSDTLWAKELKLPVRIVRGQWEDPEKGDQEQLLRFVQIAAELTGKVPLIEIASHNKILVKEVFAIPGMKKNSELSQLYGLPLAPTKIVPAEVAIRIYVPYGSPSLPYQFAQLPDNPKLAWWFLKDIIRAPFGRSRPDI